MFTVISRQPYAAFFIGQYSLFVGGLYQRSDF